MSNLPQPKTKFHGSHLLTIGFGVFTGSFWLLLGFLSLLGSPALGWQYITTLAPGVAILLLVVLARRNPVPYGSGLIALGLLPLLFVQMRTPLAVKAAFGLPLLVVGAGFIIWRDHIRPLT